MVTLIFDPLISATVWVVAALLTGAVLVAYAWKRPSGISRLRWGAIQFWVALGAAALLIVLLNPSWQIRIPPPAEKPRLAILIDESASMSTSDLGPDKSRFEVATEIAEVCAAKLAETYDVDVRTFSKQLLPTTTQAVKQRRPDGLITDLAGAITQGIDSARSSGQSLLVLSDGNHNAVGGTPRVLAAAALARSREIPVFTKTLGSDAEIHDLALRPQNPQQLAFAGQVVPLTALVRRRGNAPGAVSVILELDGKEVSRQAVYVTAGSEAEVRFQVDQAQRGLYRYEVRVETFPGEATEINNYGAFVLRVVDEPIQVLLVEGKPYWDAKFLARSLAADPSLELHSLVRVTPTRFLQRTLLRDGQPPTGAGRTSQAKPGDSQTPPAAVPGEGQPAESEVVPGDTGASQSPVRGALTESWRVVPEGANVLADAKRLGAYQVVILGRDSDVFLSEEAISNLRQWVASDSGALVCFRGMPTSSSDERFEKLLPVQWQKSSEARFRMVLTERGRDLHWFDSPQGGTVDALPSLPALATSSPGERPKPLANVLASASGNGTVDAPAVTYQPYGGGRVVVVEGAGMWRWAFLPPAYADYDAAYGTLWQSLLRWLVAGAGLLPGQDLALRTDQVTFPSGETATATLLVRREAAQGPIPAIELSGNGIDTPRQFVPTPLGDLPGVFRLDFGQLAEGRYQARIAGQPADKSGATTVFDVRSLSEEQLDKKARPDLMARIAASTGAIDFSSATADEIVKAFQAHLEQSRHERIQRTTAWDRWWVLAGIFFCWMCAWVLRRSGGLV
ncbi:MAG: VWA domain-containing protein [Planctomycetes bacterium]|nr:VWA domain-containing protein [Planctomycetota bacterium]